MSVSYCLIKHGLEITDEDVNKLSSINVRDCCEDILIYRKTLDPKEVIIKGHFTEVLTENRINEILGITVTYFRLFVDGKECREYIGTNILEYEVPEED